MHALISYFPINKLSQPLIPPLILTEPLFFNPNFNTENSGCINAWKNIAYAGLTMVQHIWDTSTQSFITTPDWIRHLPHLKFRENKRALLISAIRNNPLMIQALGSTNHHNYTNTDIIDSWLESWGWENIDSLDTISTSKLYRGIFPHYPPRFIHQWNYILLDEHRQLTHNWFKFIWKLSIPREMKDMLYLFLTQ